MLKIFNKKFNQQGFSLVETILYLAIVAILLVAVVNFNLTLSGTTSKLSANIKTSQNRRTTLGVIDYLTRNADGLLKDVDGYCMSSTTLALYFDNDDYLPGTCVENGGGVKITASSSRAIMDCYPNISINGQYGACDATIGNSYYLSAPDINIASNGLVFSTSTATSTFSSFMNINAYLTFINLANNQTELLSTSTATSTMTLRNAQPDGLIAWWKMDDSPASVITDSKNGYNGTCSPAPTAVTGLVNSSSGAFDFELSESDSCDLGNEDALNINDSFTITSWVKPESFVAANIIVHKHNWSNQTGYTTWLQSGKFYCRVCDDVGCTGPNETTSTLLVDHTYHVACTFDEDTQEIKMYVYEEGVGGIGTTTSATTRENLVNYDTNMKIGESADVGGNYFDGVIDEVRIYNRKLSDQEIWALQSQGAVAN
ncbi:prepilin-type N-terminal cleavage/methylation domain-containing protein [Candidatus Nomurabacteria bacterium]|nr:prepilin-type N-terminal cleavage/methylation domain-containing protein [Candidatus Nomurabacteria bacterium]